jgi:hypothetical protein
MKGIVGRIRAIRDTQIYRRGIVFHPARSMSFSHEESRTLQDGCISDTKKLNDARPWLTLVDTELFVEGWTQGAEWMYRNSYKPVPSSVEVSSGELPNSKLTQQDSKCDPSNQLPKR